MGNQLLTRRRFVAAVLAFSGATAVPLAGNLLPISRAWAEGGASVDPEVMAAMVHMARLLYPHDRLSDAVYAKVLDQALTDVAAGAEFARELDQAAVGLDQSTGGDWMSADAARQIQAMADVAFEPWFAAIRGRVQFGIYNGAAFWKLVGYPGPSKDFGGYLHHGAGEIDWLPEPS